MSEKCKTRKQLAAELGVSRNTLARLLKRKNVDISAGLLTPDEVYQVYIVLGRFNLEENNRDTAS